MGNLAVVPATEGVYVLPGDIAAAGGHSCLPYFLRKEKGMSRRLTVLLAAAAMSVAMLAMAGLAWAQQQEQPGEDTTTATEDTTTAEQAATSDPVVPSANRNDPKIKPISPNPGSETFDRTPTIKAKVTDKDNNDNDNNDNKLSKRDIKLYLDGDQERDFSYRRSRGLLEFTPENNLSFGKHTVKVVVKAGQGEKAQEKWSFRVEER
jgi:hypothetical protein